MKKMNSKGFTLIELLAVITIMGILMVGAVGAYSRIIENSRKDTFVDTAKKYADGARTMWLADNLSCNGIVSSALGPGHYYIEIDSSSESVPRILESGGKSSWGNRDIKGYVKVIVIDNKTAGPDGISGNADDVSNTIAKFYPVLADGLHGINVDATSKFPVADNVLIAPDKIVRGSIIMDGVEHDNVKVPNKGSTDPDLSPTICVEA